MRVVPWFYVSIVVLNKSTNEYLIMRLPLMLMVLRVSVWIQSKVWSYAITWLVPSFPRFFSLFRYNFIWNQWEWAWIAWNVRISCMCARCTHLLLLNRNYIYSIENVSIRDRTCNCQERCLKSTNEFHELSHWFYEYESVFNSIQDVYEHSCCLPNIMIYIGDSRAFTNSLWFWII